MIQPNSEDNNDIEDQKPSAKKLRDSDLPDNEHDEERMQPEEVILDLPDVNEIPGQEHIHVPQMREMQDVTIASDDEEGVGLFGDEEEDEDINMVSGNDADITEAEEDMLNTRRSTKKGSDDSRLKRSQLDTTDNEGVKLNEGSSANSQGGSDLDVSGSERDDAMEKIGGEDEENNYYSLGGDNNDNLDEGKN